MKRTVRIRLMKIALWGSLVLLLACQPLVPRPTVEVMPDFEALFSRSEGWIGADAVYSAALDPRRTVWLFGDTFIGEVEGGRRVNTVIVNNSIAIQTGQSPQTAAVAFHYGSSLEGRPAAVIAPNDGRGWFWIYDGILTEGGLYLFLVQIERSGDSSVFGFRTIGNWLCRIENPADPPARWQMVQMRLPWGTGSGEDPVLFGSAVLKAGGHLYIYGARDRLVEGRLLKEMIVARVPPDRLENFGQWRFYADGRWSTEPQMATAVCNDVANEYSVTYLPLLGKYVLVYSEGGLSPNILARLSAEPVGPWGRPIRLYRCPESEWDPRIFCYAGKGHDEVSSQPGELIVTYVSNATDMELLEDDARLYRPRFLRVRFAP